LSSDMVMQKRRAGGASSVRERSCERCASCASQWMF
jgi:hypothetical protein